MKHIFPREPAFRRGCYNGEGERYHEHLSYFMERVPVSAHFVLSFPVELYPIAPPRFMRELPIWPRAGEGKE